MLTVRGGGYMTEFNIDGDGDMYSCRYDESQDDRFCFNSDGRYTSDELSDKFNHSEEFVMTVETLEFNEMVDTTPVAASGTVSDSGWRIGGIMTGNWKSYPKIPNYSIMNIPRDPGNASAYNLGFGFSKTHENVTLGVDFVYEPIWSNTWANAAEPVTTNDGGHIPVGGKTIENDFRFSNKLLRMGIHEEGKRFGYQLGIQVRSIRYLLDQYDYIENFQRSQIEQWLE